MNVNIHSEGHVGGTTLPIPWVRGLVQTRFWFRHAPDVVPQRALRGALMGLEPAGCCGSWPLCPLKGTEGHDRPQLSVNEQRRA